MLSAAGSLAGRAQAEVFLPSPRTLGPKVSSLKCLGPDRVLQRSDTCPGCLFNVIIPCGFILKVSRIYGLRLGRSHASESDSQGQAHYRAPAISASSVRLSGGSEFCCVRGHLCVSRIAVHGFRGWSDDGRNWRALRPDALAGDAADADQHWNELSLPFVGDRMGELGSCGRVR